MKYPVAEKFKAPQGEGVHTGVPMAFIRLVGCSVGKNICHNCDTDFDTVYPHKDGGLFTPEEISQWVGGYSHVCITGGEPFDRNLQPLVDELLSKNTAVDMVHIETSGTRSIPQWCMAGQSCDSIWITVSPKPGWLEENITIADEIKVILGGLGDGPGWPTLEQAQKWAFNGRLVYIQPRNYTNGIHHERMQEVVDIVTKYPFLRLSAQLHKYIGTR